ncbi:MAG: hypothetical protein AVDCRST_MAG07-2681, partial [uncultured Frankineae bacterium]
DRLAGADRRRRRPRRADLGRSHRLGRAGHVDARDHRAPHRAGRSGRGGPHRGLHRRRAPRLPRRHGDHGLGPAPALSRPPPRPGGARHRRLRGRAARAGPVALRVERGPRPAARRAGPPGVAGRPAAVRVGGAAVAAPLRPVGRGRPPGGPHRL